MNYSIIFLFCFLLLSNSFTSAQNKILKAGRINGNYVLDGKLTEDFWKETDSIKTLTMVEPEENIPASHRTVIRIAADENKIILGIKCFDEPDKITAYSKARDARIFSEDYIKFVLDPFLDGRTGYIFAVNPFGARYDALVSNRGEDENKNWDGVWDAKTSITGFGWTAEIEIPVKTLSFNQHLKAWGFNIERKIQRLLEKDRWSGINRNYKVGQTKHAGRIINLPQFDYGLGTTLWFSAINTLGKTYASKFKNDIDASGEILQKITSDINATVTVNTDFAETEVDTRKTNLTRFPLFFPEKRAFFLEGADIFDFGLGLGRDIIPFFSRKIGLYEGTEVPLKIGGKINGKVGNTNFGALVSRTGKVDSLVPDATMGAVRIKENIFGESSVGMIGTFGDPQGRNHSWLLGFDFTYQNSNVFNGNNFLVGIWGLFNNREDLQGDKSAYGIKIDYPNDLLDISLTFKKIGDAFDPSIGFVPRKGVTIYRIGADYTPRPGIPFIRQFFFESFFSLVRTDHDWQSYGLFFAPVHFLLESGDRFEFNIRPQGENIEEAFDIAENVKITKGKYNWVKYRLEFESASKRVVSGQATWWFGGFYNGHLHQLEFQLDLRPTNNFTIGLNFEDDIGSLPQGNFTKQIFRSRLALNFSPDLQLTNYLQYDNESRKLGTNLRLRWTYDKLGDLFIVYNHNINHFVNNRWQFESNQFIIKLRYGLWF